MRMIIALCLVLATATTAAAQRGMVTAPPDPNDHSCQARAARLYPWASQSQRRAEWAESCAIHQDELDFRDRVIFGPGGGGMQNIGGSPVCITTQYGGITITVCK